MEEKQNKTLTKNERYGYEDDHLVLSPFIVLGGLALVFVGFALLYPFAKLYQGYEWWREAKARKKAP